MEHDLSSTEIAYLANNFRNFLRNNNRRARGKNNAELRNFKRNEPTKVNNIVNSAYNFGEIYNQPKIVRKILRSLTEDFRPKVTVITESKDVDSIPFDELVGSLKSYELDQPKTNKSKSMALKSIDDVDGNGFDDELSSTKIAYLAKNFRNFLRNNNRRARGKNNVEPRNFRRNDPTKVNNTKNLKRK